MLWCLLLIGQRNWNGHGQLHLASVLGHEVSSQGILVLLLLTTKVTGQRSLAIDVVELLQHRLQFLQILQAHHRAI